MPTLILVFLRILKRDCVRFLACYVRRGNEVGWAASRRKCGGMASGDEYCDIKLRISSKLNMLCSKLNNTNLRPKLNLLRSKLNMLRSETEQYECAFKVER
jgi:hypothetical protein